MMSFDQLPTYNPRELHGKRLVVSVSEDNGCVVICGTDENGVVYMLSEMAPDEGDEEV